MASLEFSELGTHTPNSLNNLPEPIQFSVQQASSQVKNPCCVFFDGIKWQTEGVHLLRYSTDEIVCETSHLTDFSILLGGAGTHSSWYSTEDIVWWSISGGVIIFMCCCVVVSITLMSIFPDLRYLILECKKPGHEKRVRRRQMERMKRKTLQAMGYDYEPSL